MTTHEKGKPEKEPQKIHVKATAHGLYGQIRQPGDQFPLEKEVDFHPSWMEHVDEKGEKVEKSPVLKAHKKREHERLVRHAQHAKIQREQGDVVPPLEEEDDEDEAPAAKPPAAAAPPPPGPRGGAKPPAAAAPPPPGPRGGAKPPAGDEDDNKSKKVI